MSGFLRIGRAQNGPRGLFLFSAPAMYAEPKLERRQEPVNGAQHHSAQAMSLSTPAGHHGGMPC